MRAAAIVASLEKGSISDQVARSISAAKLPETLVDLIDLAALLRCVAVLKALSRLSEHGT